MFKWEKLNEELDYTIPDDVKVERIPAGVSGVNYSKDFRCEVEISDADINYIERKVTKWELEI